MTKIQYLIYLERCYMALVMGSFLQRQSHSMMI